MLLAPKRVGIRLQACYVPYTMGMSTYHPKNRVRVPLVWVLDHVQRAATLPPWRIRISLIFLPSVEGIPRFSRLWSGTMSSLSTAIFVKIGVSIWEWHPKYAAAAAIFLEISDQFAYRKSPDTQTQSEAAESPWRHGRWGGVGEVPLEYVIHMPVNPNISKNWACRVNSLEFMSLAVK